MSKKIKGTKNFSEFDFYSYRENEWRLKASCKNKEVSVFFGSPKSDDLIKAKSICSGCPVNHYCLFTALQYQYYGVWGNTTEPERAYIVKKIYNNDLTDLTLDHCEKIVKMF